ncbi:heme A synthase COX15-like [Sycon ciliatum]|uniref:heme A synthase COX15-like n=1 Tax=Sycon ciliatum TaxID=27933 RepID=UPI0020AB47CC|eukprot:scpid67465/ scgid29880/ Cytochrome c oxidase assembly protein COX15 homolog
MALFRGALLTRSALSASVPALCRQHASLVRRTPLSKCNMGASLSSSLKNCLGSLRRCATKQAPPSSPAAGLPSRTDRIVGKWLLGCAGMVVGAVMLGGVTRLTESGLSMTDWHLIRGMKPPVSQEEWEAEFNRYKQFPEFEQVHHDFQLADFKKIFYMEYMHRMWGRAIGVAFALPAAFFAYKGWLNKGMKIRVGIFGSLILFQGLLGWFMVKSGLEQPKEATDIPRVSQYRLASHLGSALLLYILMFSSGLKILLPHAQTGGAPPAGLGRLRGVVHSVKGLTFITALSGAFVAGLDAGLVYNSFPKMADRWVPEEVLAMKPRWKNFFENAATVQLDHRILGSTTATCAVGAWALARTVALPPQARLAAHCMAFMAIAQASLGISTLLMHVPVSLAAAHQSGSLALLSIVYWLSLELKRLAK